MFPLLVRSAVSLASVLLVIEMPSCKRKTSEPQPPDDGRARPARQSVADNANRGEDAVYKEVMAYRYATRTAYNVSRFDELERLADEARSAKAKFGNGAWKITHFYESLECQRTEPENMWQLHERIHQAWVAAKPESITARVAQMAFLTDYAWHARGSGFSDTVTPEGWKLFGERLEAARRVLDESRPLPQKCPVWWQTGMKIALGQQWPRESYNRLCEEAKAFEPTYWKYDTMRSNYLATKWYGHEGEWETEAAKAAADPQGLGDEIYARCVLTQYANYNNVFEQSNTSWSKTQAGLELMQKRYPDSVEVTSGYCRLACIAGDRATAKQLFDGLGEHVFSYLWVNVENLRRDQAWAAQKE